VRRPKSKFVSPIISLVAVVAFSGATLAANAASGPKFTKGPLSVQDRGTAVPRSTTIKVDTSGPEFPDVDIKEFADQVPGKRLTKDADPNLTIPIVAGKSVKPAVGLNAAFPGLNHFNQRFSDGGNQFSVEPPDMGLAVGNGFVVQAVNDVMNIFDTQGNALITAASLNQFFYGEHALTRSNPPTFAPRGHSITDPTVYYDHETQRFFLTVLTFDVNPATGAMVGTDHLDVAVSTSNNPLDPWNLVQIDVSQDGFLCSLADFGPCFGDFPHVGADANGFYITTNIFGFFNFGGYRGIGIYALSKAGMVGSAPLQGVFFNATEYDTGDFVFSFMPATSPTGQYNTENGGTEYFLTALDGGAIYDNRIAVVAITNTSALDSNPFNVGIGASILQTQTYGDPLKSAQKPGDIPQRDVFFPSRPLGVLDNSDARFTQAVYANGKLFGSNTSRLQVGANPTELAGISWYIVKPRVTGSSGVSGSIWRQGYLAVAGNNLNYSSIGVTNSGKGAMTFTLVGPDYFPSSAYAILDKVTGVPGDVRVAGAGLGPQDGFTEYGSRPRWGDYSYTAWDGNSVWWASQYIGQTCKTAVYILDTTCGGTRSQSANWGTFISQVTPP
jgi:hypothetical protein